MKKIILVCFLPFVISLFAVYYFAFYPRTHALVISCGPLPNYVSNFSEQPDFEAEFLNPRNVNTTIYVLGSSELTEGGYAIPYTFIPQRFKHTNVIGIGHAGNQCFSIFSQLLANTDRLQHSKIVFIISPGWFESKPTKGTPSEIFLEYNSENFLKKILHNHHPEDAVFKAYEEKRIAQLYSEFNSPNLPLKLLNFDHHFSKSIVHEAFYAPVMICDHYLLAQKKRLTNDKSECCYNYGIPKPFIADTVSINWDSLFSFSKNETLKKVTNNDLGIEDSYYSEFIKDKRGKIEPVKESMNQELEDFKMLVQLAKEKKMDASFIISPLNPYYFKHLEDIQPTINIIENEIKENGFTSLNLLQTDTARYEKAILHDVMHMSDYGWYKVDKYIIEKYNLNLKH